MSLKCPDSAASLSVTDGTALLSNVSECSYFLWLKDSQIAFVSSFWLSASGSNSTEYIGMDQAVSSPFQYAPEVKPDTDFLQQLVIPRGTANVWIPLGMRWKVSANPQSDGYYSGNKVTGTETRGTVNLGTPSALDTMNLFVTPHLPGGSGLHYIAHLTIWSKYLTDANFTSLMSGTNPQDIENASIVFYAPFTTNTTVGIPVGYTSWTTAGSPVIDADNPTVAAPGGGGGGSLAKKVMAIQSMMRNQ